MSPNPRRVETPCLFAVVAVGAVMGGLLVGYETVGGDPDRMYRPLKVELARALGEGRLPFWSEAFGLGLPLVAESHVAAFYPPNLVAYSLLDVPTAYRLLMWLHGAALAGLTYAYARSLGLTPWGAALAFALCGFQAVHATHEPFYTLMPYLPLALLLAVRYAESGRGVWLALLALTLGVQWTIGHFQIQAWTGGLALLTGAWWVVAERRPRSRVLGLTAAVAWGAAVSAVQLALSGDLAWTVGHTQRRMEDMAFFSFPPAHWIEPALPWFFRGLRFGGEAPYWMGQGTTGYEAMFYVGTVPLILAFVGALDLGRGRPRTGVWRWVLVAALALATMPRWWPDGYALVLKVPVLGYFRAPARYTLLASLGLALLAGQGLDRAVSVGRYRVGTALALAFGLAAIAFGFFWSGRPDFLSDPGPGDLPYGVVTGAATWAVALAGIAAWRSGKVGTWLPFLVAAVELGALYHFGLTVWGWAVKLPEASPVLSSLAKEPGVGRVGGVVHDLPLRAGRATAMPYLGMALTPLNRTLYNLQERTSPRGDAGELWQRRLGVTHSVWDDPASFGPAVTRLPLDDPALDVVAHQPVGKPSRRRWWVVRHGEPFPQARAARRARVLPDWRAVMIAAGRSDDPDEAHFVASDVGPPDSPRAGSARVENWDGRTAVVTHDGACDLVLMRTFDKDWSARVNGGPWRPVVPVNGGLQAVRLSGAGAGTSRVELRYAPSWLWPGAAVSAAALAAALGIVAVSAARGHQASDCGLSKAEST